MKEQTPEERLQELELFIAEHEELLYNADKERLKIKSDLLLNDSNSYIGRYFKGSNIYHTIYAKIIGFNGRKFNSLLIGISNENDHYIEKTNAFNPTNNDYYVDYTPVEITEEEYVKNFNIALEHFKSYISNENKRN